MSVRARAAAVFALGLAAAAAPALLPSEASPEAAAFGRLPVLEGGRVKPLDSAARNALLLLSGRQSLRVDGRGKSASAWLLDVLFKPGEADAYRAFLVDDPEVLGLLGLAPGRERRFAYWQLEPGRERVREQARAAEELAAPRRSRFQSSVLALERRLSLYERLKNTLQVSGDGDAARDMAAFAGALPEALKGFHSPRPTPAQRRAVRALAELLTRYRFLAEAAAFKPLPPAAAEPPDAWRSVGEAMLSPAFRREPHPGLSSFALLGRAWRAGDAAAFASALAEHEAWLSRERPREAARARSEELFNRARPFVSGMALYLAGFLLLLAAWAARSSALLSGARSLLWAAWAVHAAGLAARVWLQGRPPVTNLYSSAVFVGWAAALLGLLAEGRRGRGPAAAAAAVAGFCALLVAHNLAASGDTMEMMRAVLDSNFWLATHVVAITLGYAATFVAGLAGLGWVFRRHLTARPDPEFDRALSSLVYGSIAFGILFSFLGTMLGGIWADQSWGRFWGWDPKENGALLIVLWNAAILHARWAGIARERGVMALAVLGNAVTAWSWFGVNMLGVGLHSYGFMDKAFWWLAAFIAVQLAAAALGLLPPRFWEERRER